MDRESDEEHRRRSDRPREEAFWKLHDEAPALWHRVALACEVNSVRRATTEVEHADEAEVADCRRPGAWSVVTPVVRLVGARGLAAARRAEVELKGYLVACLARDLPLDRTCPLGSVREMQAPPLVVAASLGLVDTVSLLLGGGASPTQRNSDGETALHAAIEQAEALSWMLESGQFKQCHEVTTTCGRTAGGSESMAAV